MGKKSKKGRDKWEDLWPDDQEAAAARTEDTSANSNEKVRAAQSTVDRSSPPEAGITDSEAEVEEELKSTSVPNASSAGVAWEPVMHDTEEPTGQRVCSGKEYRAADKGSRRRNGDKKPVPGKLGFDGIEDGGTSQSLYKNLSSGARQALQKKKLQRGQKKEADDDEEVDVPSSSKALHDGCCHVHLLLRASSFNRSLQEYMASCATQKAAMRFPSNFGGCVAAFCDKETLDPTHGSGLYACWEPLLEEKEILGVAFGLLPKEAGHLSQDLADRITRYGQLKEAVAVGVIGLDYTMATSECPAGGMETQRDAFRRLLAIAVAQQKPVILQCKGGAEAASDMMRLLKNHVEPSSQRILLLASGFHPDAFPSFLQEFPRLKLSFSGAVTYLKAKQLRELAFDCPLERLVLGSEAPAHIPAVLGGDRKHPCSHPGHLMFVARHLANIKMPQVTLDEIVEASSCNFCETFGLNQ